MRDVCVLDGRASRRIRRAIERDSRPISPLANRLAGLLSLVRSLLGSVVVTQPLVPRVLLSLLAYARTAGNFGIALSFCVISVLPCALQPKHLSFRVVLGSTP